MSRLELTVLPGRLAVCRLPAEAQAPAPRPFGAVIRRFDEVTVVCAEDDAPPGASSVQGGWRALEVAGPFELTSTVGVLASLATPLAEAGVSVFVVSTFDTDVLLVQEDALVSAVAALIEAGQSVFVAGNALAEP